MKTIPFPSTVLALAASLAFFPVSAHADILIDCGPVPSETSDLTSRGFYVSDFPGTSISTVRLAMSCASPSPVSYNIALEARENAFDGPLVAKGIITVALTDVSQFVTFPMVNGPVTNPPVNRGSTLCFSMVVAGPPDAPATFFDVIGELGLNYPEPEDPCPHIVQTHGTIPPLSIFRRDGLVLRITGDRENRLADPPLASFCHLATPGNILSHVTEISHPVLDARPDLKLFVTTNRAGVPMNLPIGVYFNGSNWAIFNEDFTLMPAGAIFHVQAFEARANVFNHLSTTANSVLNRTSLDHPLLNNNPRARLVVTRDWTIGKTYHTSHVGTWYSTGTNRWHIYTEDQAPMPPDVNFNVIVDLTGLHIITHLTDAGNLAEADTKTIIDHPRLNGNPNAKPVVTHEFIGNNINSPLAVLYVDGHWIIQREDDGAIPAGEPIQILLDDDAGRPCRLRSARDGSSMSLRWDHPYGQLERAVDLDRPLLGPDPWSPLPAASPHVIPLPSGLAREFFRLRCCPDPAMVSLRPERLSFSRPDGGFIRIHVTARNLGGPYETTTGGQVIFVYETPPGGSRTLVAQRAFGTLAPGDRFDLFYDRSWTITDPEAPEISAEISYDPSLATDGNRQNDDRNLENNFLSLQPATVNALFE